MARLEEVRAVLAVLTARCNLSCSYCYQNARRQGRMRWDTLRAAADLLLASRRREVTLVFYGGEPLLELELIGRAVEYVEAERRTDQTVKYAIVTNGTLLGRRRTAFLVTHDVKTQLSFDGVAAAQQLRGSGTFGQLDELLVRLRLDHPEWFGEKLEISMTLSPQTVPYLADGVRYFLGKGVRELGLSPIVTDSSSWRLGQIDELEAQFRRVFDACLEHQRQTGHVPLVELRRRGPEPRREPRLACGVGRGRVLTVDVDGQVYGCIMFAQSYQSFSSEFLGRRMGAMRLGDIGAADLGARLIAYPAAVHRAEIFDHQEAKYSSYRRCADCRHLMSCSFCPMAIGHQAGNADPHRVPDFLCAFNLVANRYRERFPGLPGPLVGYAGLSEEMAPLERIRIALEARTGL